MKCPECNGIWGAHQAGCKLGEQQQVHAVGVEIGVRRAVHELFKEIGGAPARGVQLEEYVRKARRDIDRARGELEMAAKHPGTELGKHSFETAQDILNRIMSKGVPLPEDAAEGNQTTDGGENS